MTFVRLHLTPELQAVICRYILSGAYPYVAAEAAGVPRAVFTRWFRKRRSFRLAILQAHARARLGAEARAMIEDPLAWLKYGPGKDAPEAPGWANPTRAQSNTAETTRLLEQPETQQLIALILRVLAPFPEVRLLVADALAQESTTDDRPLTSE
jgi:AcrR family transcriptional regulator